ncbi:MAG: ribonuclease H [Saprospiraceae bacterium]|nr:MAG: ribonuclease H [Saprospiraceae bacterium]
MVKQKKYYVVWQGNKPGVYDNWEECQLQIKGFADARYKSYLTQAEAEAAFKENFAKHIYKNTAHTAPKPANVPSTKHAIVWDSISVDAACSGNPGLMEYQGVHTTTKQQIFHQKFAIGTNNIGEFLAIVHALAMFEKQGKKTPIYTDSRTALAWVRNKKCKSKLERNPRTENLWQLLERAEVWLKTHTWENPILKWETEYWGEIPADFGRK